MEELNMSEKTVEQIMETEYLFETLVKVDHPRFGSSAFARGKILAWQEMICDNGIVGAYPIKVIDEGRIFKTKCTPDKYDEFTKRVNSMYPDLCVFNYQTIREQNK
jgi:hypothetical protein